MAAPVHYLPLPSQSETIFDMGRVDRRRPASTGAMREAEVAQQFEALLLQQWIKQARQAAGTSGPFESDQTRFAQALADEQLALQLAQPGMGLAQALLNQIRGDAAAGPDAAQTQPLRTSRRADLRSSVGVERPIHADSLSDLIEQLGNLQKTPTAQGATWLTATAGAPEHIMSFVARMAPAAQAAAQESGLPAALILSQAALESGWGRREIKYEDGRASHNLFGIKATRNWGGKVVDILTTEYVGGKAQKQVASFRAYDSYADSFRDYARLLSQSERYRSVREAATAELAAQRVQEAGYATDPQYAEKLVSIMGYFKVHGTGAPAQLAGASRHVASAS